MVESLDRIASGLLDDPWGLTAVLSVLAVVPGAAGTQIVLSLPAGLESEAAAAVTEPVTTKFLPASVAVALARRSGGATRVRLVSRPAVFGAWGGFAFGVAERLMYAATGSPVEPLWTAPVVLHALFGMLAAGPVYRCGAAFRGVGDRAVAVLGLLAAVAVHYLWNVVVL